jgi:hypothetical protein
VIEQLRVPAPSDGRFELRLGFLLAEVFIEQVFEDAIRQCMVGARFQRAGDLADERDVFQRGGAEQFFPPQDVGLGKRAARRRDFDVAFFSNDRAAASRYISSRPLWPASISSRPATAPRRACGSI